MTDFVIDTGRLRIVPLSISELEILRGLESDPGMKQAYGEMIDTMKQLPGREEWGTNWKIALPSGETVGGLCFKGPPGSDGVVEIGYGIEEAFRRRGYATEAVGAIVRWALAQNGVRCVVAQTHPENAWSQKVLLNNGFARGGFGQEGPLFRIGG